MAVRADDFLGVLRYQDPRLARRGWQRLAEATDGAKQPAGIRAVHEMAQRRLAGFALVESNRQLEAVKFRALDGTVVDLSRMRGQVVLLDFWAMWCKPCVEELPVLKSVYEKYRDVGFTIIGVSGDEGAGEKLRAFVRQHGYDWPQHFNGKGTNNELAQIFGVKSWPTSYLIDMDGKVVASNLRGAQLEPAVRKYLGLE
jgi:thiol-disulfide isomerase/thioredoxin